LEFGDNQSINRLFSESGQHYWVFYMTEVIYAKSAMGWKSLCSIFCDLAVKYSLMYKAIVLNLLHHLAVNNLLASNHLNAIPEAANQKINLLRNGQDIMRA